MVVVLLDLAGKLQRQGRKHQNVTFFKGKNELLTSFKLRIPENKRLFTSCILDPVDSPKPSRSPRKQFLSIALRYNFYHRHFLMFLIFDHLILLNLIKFDLNISLLNLTCSGARFSIVKSNN